MIVSVKDLVKKYGNLVALDHFGLEVAEGEIFGFLGPNGSGKTTAINCILSLLKYESGEIEIFGKPMTPESYEAKRNIGIVMQNVAVFDELTVFENVDYFCGLYIDDKKKRAKLVNEAIDFVELNEFRKFYPKKLSGGLLRRLNIACGIAHKPKLIILDEPTVGVDPQSRNKILEGIVELNKNGATVIYTSHYMEEVEQICSRIAIMDKGRVISIGTNVELKNLIQIGEIITVELIDTDGSQIEDIVKLKNILSYEFENNALVVKFSRGKTNITSVLDYLKSKNISYDKIYCELPSLNDVFLEITGKQLRD